MHPVGSGYGHPVGSGYGPMPLGSSMTVPVAHAGGVLLGRSPSMVGMPSAFPMAHPMAQVAYSSPPPLSAPTIEHPPMTAPQKFTEGIPDEQSILRQKSEYNRNLDDQLGQGTKVLHEQNQKRKEYLNQVASQQKAQFNLQVDQQLKAQEMALDQQYSHQLMTLQQAAHEQKSALEAQANTLALDYQQKKAHEDFAFQQYEIQRTHYEAQSKFSMELKRLEQQERETVVPNSFVNPVGAPRVNGSYVPPVMSHGAASYSPPPTIVSSRPSLSYTPSVAPRSAITLAAPASMSVLPTAQVVSSYPGAHTAYSAPPTSYAALPTSYAAPPTSYAALPTTYAAYAR